VRFDEQREGLLILKKEPASTDENDQEEYVHEIETLDESKGDSDGRMRDDYYEAAPVVLPR
jgi:hypothetical protein